MFKKAYSNIVDDPKKILQKPVLIRTQDIMVKILSLLNKIPKLIDKKIDEQPDKETDEQLDTTDMPKSESGEPAEQKGVGLKILTPSQMLSRLPMTLAQLKAGNSSKKLKNQIRQLLHSSKKLTKTIYNNLINTI